MPSQKKLPPRLFNLPQPRFVTAQEQAPENPYHNDPNVDYVEEVVYEEDEEDINIDNVDGEVEVDSRPEDWMVEGPPNLERMRGSPKKPTHGVVLKTVDDLRLRPQLHASRGKRPATYMPRNDPNGTTENYGEDHDPEEPGPSSVPSIRAGLRMYANAAIQNTIPARIADIQDDLIQYETDSDVDCDPVPSKPRQTAFTHRQWPVYHDKAIAFREASEILCGSIEPSRKMISTSIPQEFKGEGTFIIDIRSLKSRYDLNGDGIGPWGKPTGKVRCYTRSQEDPSKIERVDYGSEKLHPGTKFIWKCMQKRYEHPTESSSTENGANKFIKKIYTVLHPPELNKAATLAVICYEWNNPEETEYSEPTSSKYFNRPSRRNISAETWASSSFHNNSSEALPSGIQGFFGDIPIYSVGVVEFNAAASIILGGTMVEPTKIAQSVPQGYRDSGSFVIDTENFVSSALLRRDDNGIWGKPSGTSRYYVLDSNSGDAIRVDTANRFPTNQIYDIQILCKKYEHPSTNSQFVRKIYTGRTSATSTNPHRINLAVLTYFWKGKPVHFETKRQNHVQAAERRFYDYGDCSHIQQTKRSRPQENGLMESQVEKERRDALWKKEYENQVRFSAILDRAEAFLGRLEQAGRNVVYTQDIPPSGESPHDWVHPDEEIVGSEGINKDGYKYPDEPRTSNKFP